MSLGNYEQFTRYFHERSGINLSCYKRAQMQRRIDQFITNKGFQNYLAFNDSLNANPELLAAFLRHLTINVSQFFRDISQWETLRTRILPMLLAGRSSLKIWSAGSSGGQEAYTIAISLQESIPLAAYSILGTDIDEVMLAQARNASYKSNDLQGVPPHIVAKYFSQSGDVFQVKDRLKANIRFQKGNLLTGVFDTGYDLICCRNVVIYFTEEAKNSLYSRFSKSLRPGGVLFTGSTEQIFNLAELGFKSIAPFFYQKTPF